MAFRQSLFVLGLALLLTLGQCRDHRSEFGPIEYGGHCDIDFPCNSEDFTNPLDCSDPLNGTCVCLSGLAQDPVSKRCVSPANGICTLCTTDHPHYRVQCGESAECVPDAQSENCVDLEGAKRPGWVDGVCKILAGNAGCTTDDACISNAVCQSGTCTCKPDYESDGKGHCIGKEDDDTTTTSTEPTPEKTTTDGSGSITLVPSFIALTLAITSTFANQ